MGIDQIVVYVGCLMEQTPHKPFVQEPSPIARWYRTRTRMVPFRRQDDRSDGRVVLRDGGGVWEDGKIVLEVDLSPSQFVEDRVIGP